MKIHLNYLIWICDQVRDALPAELSPSLLKTTQSSSGMESLGLSSLGRSCFIGESERIDILIDSWEKVIGELPAVGAIQKQYIQHATRQRSRIQVRKSDTRAHHLQNFYSIYSPRLAVCAN